MRSSSNGRTFGRLPKNRGSNPWERTNFMKQESRTVWEPITLRKADSGDRNSGPAPEPWSHQDRIIELLEEEYDGQRASVVIASA